MDIRPIAAALQSGAGAVDRQVSALTSAPPAKPVAQPSEQAAAVQQPAAVPDADQLEHALKNVNKLLRDAIPPQNVEFTIDTESEQVIVKIVDQKTKEVLRQIPSEEALELAKAMDLSKGLLIRQKV